MTGPNTSIARMVQRCEASHVSIGKRIKEARKAVRITQSSLASELGVESLQVSRWERDISNPRDLKAVASALRCDAGWLLTGKGPDDGEAEAPDYPALHTFLGSTMGKTATDDELQSLRSIRFLTGKPTDDSYRMALLMLRGTLE